MPPSNDNAWKDLSALEGGGGSSPGGERDLDKALLIDQVCDKFEDSWKTGPAPDLETYLSSHGWADSELFFELVRIDFAYRHKAGEEPSLDRYAQQFPQYEKAVSDLRLVVDSEAVAAAAAAAEAAAAAAIETRFRLVQELGSGSFAKVWKAWDNRLHRMVALKRFHKSVSSADGPLFEREARAVAVLDHPNIVRVLDVSTGGPSDVIVFEYVEGVNLKQFAESHPDSRLPAETAAGIAQAIARALQHMHDQGVVHRDLKPENILIDREGVPKIVDFGLARHADVLATISQERSILGTVPYMSPEQCRGEVLTFSSDIYSLGVILYEMLAGVRPFLGTRDELLQRIQFAPVPKLRTVTPVPAPLERICGEAMERHPADRYASAAFLADDLERFQAGQAAATSRRVRRWLRRIVRQTTPVRAAVGMGALTLMAAATALMMPSRAHRSADGRQTVRAKTYPQGANLAFVPVDPATGVPQIERTLRAPGTTPTSLRLPPGDYLVVATLADGSGRFHEVYRHVPADAGETVGAYRHLAWETNGWGEIEIPEIPIPRADITESMVRVDGSDRFFTKGAGAIGAGTKGAASKGGRESIETAVPTFYVDPQEFTWRDYRRVVNGRPPANLNAKRQGPDDEAATLSYDEAVARAEEAGKRLLTEVEFEFLATGGGTRRYPWGDEAADDPEEVTLGPVGTPAFDRFQIGETTIVGLCSNVSEWTDTLALFPPDRLSSASLAGIDTSQLRVVRGGTTPTFLPQPVWKAAEHEPRVRTLLNRFAVRPGVGFRCARSLAPRLTAEGYVRLQSEPAFPDGGNSTAAIDEPLIQD